MSGGPYGRGKAPERVSMPLHQWPKADLEVWTAATAAVDPFADQGGERVGMRAHSNRRLQSSYGRWLTFLERSGDLAQDAEPAKRIQKDTVEQFVRTLQALGNMPSTIALRLTDLLAYGAALRASCGLGVHCQAGQKGRCQGKQAQRQARVSSRLSRVVETWP